jgi:hypothetical protein
LLFVDEKERNNFLVFVAIHSVDLKLAQMLSPESNEKQLELEARRKLSLALEADQNSTSENNSDEIKGTQNEQHFELRLLVFRAS